MKQETKIGMLNLGCPRNLADSENILGRLSSKGYSIVDMEHAQVALINTCAFTREAKEESIDAILDLVQLKKEGRLKKIIVYGCLAQRYKEELCHEVPEIDAFIGKISLNHSPKRFPITPIHYVYLKICEGCISNCSFCVIPSLKGKFTSLSIGSILSKVKEFSNNRVSELNIIGQDITGFGIDLYGKPSLAQVVGKIIEAAKNIGWIRLLYLNPKRIDEGLLKLIAGSPKVCKYIDLPIQHANARILKLMNRQMPKKALLKLIERIRKTIPGVALRTSIIVGFPSETEKEFKELVNFIKEVKFERLGAFTYSREEGTPAYNFKKQVPQKIKDERLQEIMSVQQTVSKEVNKNFLGRYLDVLIEEKGDGYYLGRSQYDAPEVDGLVYIYSKKLLRQGEFVKAKIIDTLEYDLVGIN